MSYQAEVRRELNMNPWIFFALVLFLVGVVLWSIGRDYL
jgi:hypothetical protein